MSKTDGLQDDLRYVRSVLNESEQAGSPAAIYYLWAVLCFAGFALIDWKPQIVGLYWLVAGPVGGVASAWLGRRAGHAIGQRSEREGRLHLLHWTGLMIGIVLIMPLPVKGLISMRVLPSIILLLVATSYFTAGIYLDRRMRFVGIVMAACYFATVFVTEWPWIWTCTGGMLAASLVVSGLLSRASWRGVSPGEPS